MEMTIANPQKGRLETINIEFTEENTTWFEGCDKQDDVYRITDFEGGLLISESGYSYPILIYEQSRAEIDFDRTKARQLRKMAIEG
jgi:hypothetical protein